MPPDSIGSSEDNSKDKRSVGSTMSRRTFLGISGAAAAGLIALYYIKWPSFDFFSSPDDVTEGVDTEKWTVTSCLNCPTRCAIKVRVVNGKAVRIVGNDRSTYSDGKTCPRSHIGLQVLYDPNRVKNPLRRTNGNKGKDEDPEWEEIKWDDALTAIKDRLNSLSNPERLLIIQGLNTTSDEDLINRFAKSFGTLNLLREDNLETEADRKGKLLANVCNNSGYDLENANYILSFGADIIESEDPLSRNLRLWGKIRRERPNRARVVVIDPRYSLTASKADEWIPIKPGYEGALAMSIANVIVSKGLYDDTTDFFKNRVEGFEAYKGLVQSEDFKPENIADTIGISADVIRRIAEEFASFKPAIAWTGAGATSWPHGSYASHAIFCLNALVGSIDVKGGIIYQESPPYEDMPTIGGTPGISLREVKDSLSNIDTIIGFNSNLIMSVPDTKDWDEALSKPYYVHIAPSLTEMAKYADIVLPACTYLEEWAYESAPPGSGYAEAKIKQPVIEPLYYSRPTAQIIFDLASGLKDTVKDAFKGIGDNPKGFVEYRTAGALWNKLVTDGVWKGPDYQYSKYDQIFENGLGKFRFDTDSLGKGKLVDIEFIGDDSEYPLVLTTYHPVLDIRNGNQNYPWAQEIFLVMHGYGWNNFVEMNSHDADEKGIKDGDMVWVESELGRDNRIKAKARVFEGIIPGAVAIASGQGHYSCGKWADGIGVNPNEVIGIDYDDKSGQASLGNTRVKIYKA